jgi:hypothetical protein
VPKDFIKRDPSKTYMLPARYLGTVLVIAALDDEVNWEDGVLSYQPRLGPFMI